MASIRKYRGRFQVQIRRKGFQSENKTFDKVQDAKLWAFKRELAIKSGHRSPVRGKTFIDALDRYALEVTPKKKSMNNEIKRIGRLKRTGFSFLPLEDLTSDHLQQWIDSEVKRVLPSSVNRDLSLISAVLIFAIKRWNWLEKNHLLGVDKPKDPPHRVRRISEDEIQTILAALDYVENEGVTTQRQHIAAGFLLALETAMRQGAIWKLKWSDVDLDRAFVTLYETKNHDSRDVPLSKRAIELLEKLMPDSPQGRVIKFNQDSCSTIFRRVVNQCGITDMTFHDSRHEATTRLAKKLDVASLCKVIGHRDLRSMMIYYNPTATELAKRLD